MDWKEDTARAEAQERLGGWRNPLWIPRQVAAFASAFCFLGAIGTLAYQAFKWLTSGDWPSLTLWGFPQSLTLFLCGVGATILAFAWLRMVEDRVYGPHDGPIPPGYRR